MHAGVATVNVAVEPGAGHPVALGAARAYLTLADRLVPGRICGLYLVGSAALGAFRPCRSDVDLVVVVDGPRTLPTARLRTLHVVAGLRTAGAEARERRSPLSGTCNAAWIHAGDLTRPVEQIEPLASHTGHELALRAAFDVNPVVWKVLAERGIAVRGPAPTALGMRTARADELTRWNRRNLAEYWVPWAERVASGRDRRFALRPRWSTAWGVLGAPRLHRTATTGEVIDKESAGAHALEVLGERWRPIVDDALAYRRGTGPPPERPSRAARAASTSSLVLEVARSAGA